MGKFIDQFFAFPIRMYDGFSLKKTLDREEKEELDAPLAIDWVVGTARLPASELPKLMWHDGFSRDRTVEEVAKDGFDTTVVFSQTYGEYVCVWGRKKFEQKIDEFMEKYEETKRTEQLKLFAPYIGYSTIHTSTEIPPKPGIAIDPKDY